MIQRETLIDNPRWHYLHMSDPFPVSGWKIHIFGNTLDDSLTVGNAIMGTLEKCKLRAKIASEYLVKVAIGVPENKQYGKIATIYLSSAAFHVPGIASVIKSLKDDLLVVGYEKKGVIYGDKSIDDTLHYRYELFKVIDPKKGVDYVNYANYYEPNRGSFNIPENPDIFELFNA